MQFFLTVGAWGDVFAGMGHAVKLMQKCDGDYGMVHYGFDPDISVFLEEQKLFKEVKHAMPDSRAEYQRLVGLAGRASNGLQQWLPEIVQKVGVAAENTIPVQMHDVYKSHVEPERWFNARLPDRYCKWADVFLKEEGLDRFYLLNPVSLQCVSPEDHWPYWNDAIKWLLSCTSEKYLLVGERGIYGVGENANLVNLSGYTESMLEVLALADRSAGIITTVNSLTLWSVIQAKACVAASHKQHNKQRYFCDWIEHYPNKIVEYDQGLDVFSTLFQGMVNDNN